ncbi:hypothetical protein [Agrococcus sp. DT81.2]
MRALARAAAAVVAMSFILSAGGCGGGGPNGYLIGPLTAASDTATSATPV